MARLAVEGSTDVTGRIEIPGSKYHAHRALIMAALATGESRIEGWSDCAHVAATMAGLRRFGVRIRRCQATAVVSGGLSSRPSRPINAHSSGSTLQFLAGVGALPGGPVDFTGSRYLRRRPITPLLQALTALGATVDSAGGRLPFRISGPVQGGKVVMAGYLSQWVSGVLIPAPCFANDTVIEIEGEQRETSYIDLTVDMMTRFGARVDRSDDHRTLHVSHHHPYRPTTYRLPGDWSSAAFWLVLGAIVPGADITLGNLDPTVVHPEAAILKLLRDMGARIDVNTQTRIVRIQGRDRLSGLSADCRDCPDLVPILCVAAACASGRSELRRIGHVRYKESDRAAAMLQLRRMGGRMELQGETLTIDGVARLNGAEVSSYNDHRLAMAFAVAGAAARGRTAITFPSAPGASYPEFAAHLAQLGVRTGIRQRSPREVACGDR